MIAKMKKYSFLVYHKEYTQFLEKLRELGVLHVQEKESGIPEDDALMQHMQLHKRLLAIKKDLRRRNVEAVEAKSLAYTSGFELADAYDAKVAELDKLNQDLAHVDKDVAYLAPWGQFDQATIESLSENGIEIKFFSTSGSKYNPEWEKEGNVFKIGSQGSMVFFIQVVKENDEVIDADPVKLPHVSLNNLLKQKETLQQEIAEVNDVLDQFAVSGTELLDKAISMSSEEVDFNKVVLGSEAQAENKLMVLEGWVPEDDEMALEVFLRSESVVFDARKPKGTDNVPIKLKNNRFNRLFEMIADLYSRPKYSELDLTPFLAPFYLLFFGFCFSDAGYGLLFLLGATYFKMKSTDENKGVITLVQLLGASTIFFGILGGVFFGIELYKTNLPFYSSIAQAYGTDEKPITDLVQDIMMKASLGLGVIQILFGMFLKAAKLIKEFSFKYAISTLSWAFFIITFGVNIYTSSTGGVALFKGIFLPLYIVWAIGIFFMNTPGKNLAVQFGTGLWDAYNTIVGGVGDLLSYVRLFALGLASGILGLVFNDLAGKVFNPEAGIVGMIFGFIGMVLILVIGHAINIFMSGLGSMVHPLRLTFVEFYKNAGFEGGGIPFNPFHKKVKA